LSGKVRENEFCQVVGTLEKYCHKSIGIDIGNTLLVLVLTVVSTSIVTKYDTNINFSFEKQQDSRTRGHNLKLVSHRHHYDLRKYSFTARIVVTWNSLPESVIAAETTDCFKNRLDKFWNNHELIFDYKAELTGIGNRSNII